LDANGDLQSRKQTNGYALAIRLLSFEQPLPVAQFDAMLELSDRYSTQLALDESVATLDQLQLVPTGLGDFVIKAAIAVPIPFTSVLPRTRNRCCFFIGV